MEGFILDDDFWEFVEYVEDDGYEAIPRNIIRDGENPLEMYADNELVQRYRFSRNTIMVFILPLVFPPEPNANQRGMPIPPLVKLCVALRYFATGSFQRVSGDLYHISQASVCRIVIEAANKLLQSFRQFIKFPTTAGGITEIKNAFYAIAGFPGVIGCVDGTHIEIKSPGGDNAEIYRNRKGWMSLNVQVVAGPYCNIQDIVIRWPGSAHDSRIFNNSGVQLRLQQGYLPGILLGDSAYQQTRHVYTPLLHTRNRAEERYNIAHIRTRNVVERTFGIWKSRFRCHMGAMQCSLQNTTKIIAATAILHNIAILHEQPLYEEGHLIERAIPQPLADVVRRGNMIREAFIQRHFVN